MIKISKIIPSTREMFHPIRINAVKIPVSITKNGKSRLKLFY